MTGSGESVLFVMMPGLPSTVVKVLFVTVVFCPEKFANVTLYELFKIVPLAKAALTFTVMLMVNVWLGLRLPTLNVVLPAVGAGLLPLNVTPLGYVSSTVMLNASSSPELLMRI